MTRLRSSAADAVLAYALLRITVGMNIAMHGLVRIARPENFQATLGSTFKGTPLPAGFLSAFGAVLPWVEAAVGILVFLGLATRWALVAGALLMFVLTFGSTLAQKWDTAAEQVPYEIAYWILLSFRAGNGFSLDALMSGWRRVNE
jgi:thiosulfate dehydrogenase [quinone] large subunit